MWRFQNRESIISEVLNIGSQAEKVAQSFCDLENLPMPSWMVYLTTIANNMEHIYYFLLLCFAIFVEWQHIFYAEKVVDLRKNMNNEEWKKTNKDYYRWYAFLSFVYSFLVLIWFFSFQWWAFLLFFILSFVKTALPKKIFIEKIDGIVSLCIVIFMVLNAFHFHINLF